MNISVAAFNAICSDLYRFKQSPEWRKLPAEWKVVEEKTIKECDGSHRDQGENGERYLVIDIGEEFFLKVSVLSDPYGEQEWVDSMQLVKGVPKQVTVYEWIDDQC